MAGDATVLVIACGALAREIVQLRRLNGWSHLAVQCLPAELHNTPHKIPAAVRAKLEENRDRYARLFVAYGDCGTSGELDRVLAETGAERIPGAHCYEFFAGSRPFAALCEAEPGTFFLTDFLARHFERLVIRGLGLDRHPELTPLYFGNYRRLIYLAQTDDPQLDAQARRAAERLGLVFQRRDTGYGGLGVALARLTPEKARSWPN